MITQPYQKSGNDFDGLSLRDLMEARDAYHVHLMNHPNVVATALGRYRIRSEDAWPVSSGTAKHKRSGPRTLKNSEIRPYSWPAILVFVDEWAEIGDFGKGSRYNPDQVVPKTLFLPDGRKVPVCVTLVERVLEAPPTPDIRFPLNNIGGGNPVIADVQGREHVATIACLVSDGHRNYALASRHVTGNPGEVLFSRLNGRTLPIGRSSDKQLTRLPFSEVYPEWGGKKMYLNLDAGLIDIDDLDGWTARVHGVGTIGPLADLSSASLSLALVGCRVVGCGAASGRMEGEIAALLYRYKAVGGFEYLADFLIGPRANEKQNRADRRAHSEAPLLTRPGDSGALWLFDPLGASPRGKEERNEPPAGYRPFAVQWGAHVFAEGGALSYALATSLSTICDRLDVDLVRDWNLDQTDTWGSVGHFSIASCAADCLTNTRLKAWMSQNALLISPAQDEILSSEFKGLGSDEFVPLADVPDMFWKLRVAHQGFARPLEGPNHFADMDQVREQDGKTLLDLARDDGFINPDKWNAFYSSVGDPLTGKPIEAQHRGLLPFRVWQIFDEMVRFVADGRVNEFVCAAGVLAHYVGDACQPLHISYLHDGDPEQPVTRTVHHKTGGDEDVVEPRGAGVHSAYENGMVSAFRDRILAALATTPKIKVAEIIQTGFEAAKATIEIMRTVFKQVPPSEIVRFYIESDAKPKQLAKDMWSEFGTGTTKCMQDGVHLLAILWQSAWSAGNGDQSISNSAKGITKAKAMAICQDADFLPSLPIHKIGTVLQVPD